MAKKQKDDPLMAPAVACGDIVARVPMLFRGHMVSKYAINALMKLLNSSEAVVPGAKVRLKFSLDYEGDGNQFFTVRYIGKGQ